MHAPDGNAILQEALPGDWSCSRIIVVLAQKVLTVDPEAYNLDLLLFANSWILLKRDEWPELEPENGPSWLLWKLRDEAWRVTAYKNDIPLALYMAENWRQSSARRRRDPWIKMESTCGIWELCNLTMECRSERNQRTNASSLDEAGESQEVMDQPWHLIEVERLP